MRIGALQRQSTYNFCLFFNMNNGFINFIVNNIVIKFGLRKEKRVGIRMKNVSNVILKGVRTEGYESGIEIENASDFKGDDFEAK